MVAVGRPGAQKKAHETVPENLFGDSNPPPSSSPHKNLFLVQQTSRWSLRRGDYFEVSVLQLLPAPPPPPGGNSGMARVSCITAPCVLGHSASFQPRPPAEEEAFAAFRRG